MHPSPFGADVFAEHADIHDGHTEAKRQRQGILGA